jgi:hypothetical protein
MATDKTISEEETKTEHKEIFYDENTVNTAYLKVINVPCMHDLGTLQTDPTDSRLCLNVIDDLTFHKVVKPDFLNGKSK